MAKIRKGILGPVSGKIRPVIGSSWKGIPYVRGETQNEPKERTNGQLATQQKMKFINNMLVPFHPYINIGFANNALQKTEISAAFSLNYDKAFLGIYPDLSVDYSNRILIVGKLPMIEDIMGTLIDPENAKLTWSQNNVRPASFDDQLMLILYCEKSHKTDGLVGGFKRTDTQCTFKFNPKFAGKTLHLFVSMTSIDRKRIANSIYFVVL